MKQRESGHQSSMSFLQLDLPADQVADKTVQCH
jgi:hypothetical protein